MKAIIKSFFTPNIILAVVGVFVVRLVLSLLPSFSVDMGTWLAWAGRLKDLGPSGFYSDSVWTQYTPGFLYWLWLIGKLGLISELAIKIPVILADLVVGGIIWWLIKKVDKRIADLAFFFYVLNPAVIFNGSIWGQIDGIFALSLVLSAIFLIESDNPTLSGIFWGISLLIKPQAIAILPALALVAFKKFSFKGLFLSGLAALLIVVIGSLAFFPNNPLFGFPDLFIKMQNFYAYTSVFAFNIWTVIGMWLPDSKVFAGLSFYWWGIILYLLSFLGIFLRFKETLKTKESFYLVLGLTLFSFFLFPTRIHERYLFPALAFLLIYAGLKRSKGLLAVFGLVSFLHLINLYYPYAYYEGASNILKNEFLQTLTGELATIVGISFLILFLLTFFWDKFNFDLAIDKLIKKIFSSRTSSIESGEKFEEGKISSKRFRFLLIGLLVFSLATRIYQLGSPSNEYFDEVYHAFTAKVVLHNDPKAWEWWNTPPSGFAYEWTHPPLAKLGMVVGMLGFGENSFGWRFPGALFGVGSVFLVVFLAREIFKDDLLAILSGAVFSLDGLTLVMARIGMNDVYVLFFSLLAIYLFLKDKAFFSAVAFGLALSSKWSALWVIPIILVSHFVFKKKIRFSYLWFFLLPPTVYLASYFDMFLTGHGIDIWWGMQKQMWWYHTNLKATHPYTSPWWTWPLLIRPIYLYTSNEIGGWVSRIYAIGNPFVFWFGALSICASSLYAYLNKNKKIAWVVFSYLVFFAPWALSPRIMFLYHYLPSIPFLAIASGYVLRKFPRLILPTLLLFFISFIYFYPHWAGLSVPLWLDKSYYWFSSWR